jgi:hypothetical protein
MSGLGESDMDAIDVGAARPSDEARSAVKALDQVLKEIRHASRRTETTFVGIGERLESSISTLDGLTATFNKLILDLESEEMRQATATLSRVAKWITDLASTPSGALDVLSRISDLTGTITGRVGTMRKAVKAVDVLAVNAKIAAAHINSDGGGFTSFADEIGRALKVAQVNLDRFTGELAGMSGELNNAMAGQRDLKMRRDTAIQTIPEQLARSIAAIAMRRKQAASTATAVQKRTHDVGRRVGNVVMAMQIGDTARQRIEHTEFALDLMEGLFNNSGSRNPSLGIDAGALSVPEKEALFATICALQSAQLSDTAHELEGQLRQVVASLADLAIDARDIAALGQQTYASGNDGAGSFLSGLEADVGEAQTLLDGLGTAQTAADQVMASVLATTKSLVQNISVIQSLEADIRLMGLNTTLRCGRLGTEGKPLTVIAQELRACSNLTAAEAELVMSDLDAMVAAAGTSSGVKQDQRLAEITEVAAMMTSSVELMSKIAQTLDDALSTLDRQSEAVIVALEQTAAEITANAEIGAILHRASAHLNDVREGLPPLDVSPPACQEQIFAAIAKTYTMAREREIQGQILGGNPLPDVPPAAPAGADLDDIFF